jgi:hypothetical protein
MGDEFDDYAEGKIGHVGDRSTTPDIDKAARSARKEWERLEESGELDTVIDHESEFLAKMYVCAEHLGALPKFKKLLGSAMRLRPDKVLVVAGLFDSLSLAYDDIGTYAGKYRNQLEINGDFAGRAADAYYAEYDTLTEYLHKGDTSAKQLAENTSDLMAKFAEALIDWRRDFAAAIRLMAEHDRNEAWVAAKELTLALVGDNPYEAARNTLNAMLDAWERADSQGRANDATLRKFSEDRGFGLDDPQHDDVSRHDVVLPDPWDGKL